MFLAGGRAATRFFGEDCAEFVGLVDDEQHVLTDSLYLVDEARHVCWYAVADYGYLPGMSGGTPQSTDKSPCQPR